MNNFLAMFRVRIKVRLFGKEWQFGTGDPGADKVIFQVAVTIPLIFGLDLEIFA
jgi:hypothetical protein